MITLEKVILYYSPKSGKNKTKCSAKCFSGDCSTALLSAKNRRFHENIPVPPVSRSLTSSAHLDFAHSYGNRNKLKSQTPEAPPSTNREIPSSQCYELRNHDRRSHAQRVRLRRARSQVRFLSSFRRLQAQFDQLPPGNCVSLGAAVLKSVPDQA